MSILLLATLLLLTPAAHAKLMLHCVAERAAITKDEYGEPGIDYSTVVDETQETEIAFEPFEFNEYKADATITFKMLPTSIFHVRIFERLNGDTLKWSSQIIGRRKTNGDVIGRGGDRLGFQTKDGKFRIGVICDAYDKSESLILPPPAQTERERLRNELVQLASTRAYVAANANDPEQVSHLEPLIVLDVYRVLLKEKSDLGDRLRQTVSFLSASGFRQNNLSALDEGSSLLVGSAQLKKKASTCSGTHTPKFTCDIERLTLEISFSGKVKTFNPNDNLNEMVLVVGALVYRESESRLIRGYRITTVGLQLPEGRGGGGSTSGGKINGGGT